MATAAVRRDDDAQARAHAPGSHRLAYLGLSLATVGWASGFVVGKAVLAQMTPLALASWRYAVATLALLPFALRAGDRAPLPGARTGTRAAVRAVAVPLAVMVVAGGILYPWLFLAALERTSATNTSLLIALNPVLTLLLTPLIGERLVRRRLGGAAIAFAGAALVISRGDPRALLALDLNRGDVLAVVAAACWAGFNLAARPVVGRLAPSVVNCAVYGGGGAALFALGWSEDPVAQLVAATPAALAGVAAMAILSSVIAGQLFLLGLRTAGVGRAVVFVYLVPVLTAALSATLLDEAFTAAQAGGGATVLLGLWLATRPEAA